MRALESLKVGGGVALLMGMSVSTAGCANDYTCVDYRNCAPDGSADASADVVRGDARGDGSVTHDGAAHDGATDGGSDARVVDGGAEAAPVDSGKDAGCNPSGPPSTSPCSIADEYAVFVAPSKDGGSDAGTGTMAAPYATIAEGIANAGGKRVYVCSATYAESLVIGTSLDGAQVYGGFACPASDAGAPAWTYVSGMVAAVAPGVAGYALDLESLSKGAHFEDMSFTAVEHRGAGECV